MTYILKALAVIGMIMSVFPQQSFAYDNKTKKNEGSIKVKKSNRRLLVRYKDEASPRKKAMAHFSAGAYVIKSFELPSNLEVVEVVKGVSVKAAQELLEENPDVLYVEPDYELHAFFTPPPTTDPPVPTPTIDPKLSEQWGLNNAGQTGGKADADINGPELWAFEDGGKDIVIGVIDTGINYHHPDLKANVWVNPYEIAGNNVDDDGNGIVDDVHGYNSIVENGDPMDDHGHGSHCAGIIAAEGLNNYGGRGVMPKASVIGCKFLTASGSGTTSDAIDCINYFHKLQTRQQNPVRIFATSNSWGGDEFSQALQDAIKAHLDAGILFFAAASNDGRDNDRTAVYPANYPLANVVSVAATDHNDEKAVFSNYGLRTVHVGAPGVDILSTTLGESYETWSGTSMATPFAAGLAGMIKAANPALDFIGVKNLLISGGTPIAALQGKTISGRRIRAIEENGRGGSLACEDQEVTGRLSPSLDQMLVPVGSSINFSAININCARPNGEVEVRMSPGNEILHLSDRGIGTDSAAGDGMYSSEWIANTPGHFEFIFPADDKVIIEVYDASLLNVYKYNEEVEFAYRQFEGVKLEAEDDSNQIITSPFSIPFAGQLEGFRTLNVSSNGVLSFTNTDFVQYENAELPFTNFVTFIAPWWDDLNPGASGDSFPTPEPPIPSEPGYPDEPGEPTEPGEGDDEPVLPEPPTPPEPISSVTSIKNEGAGIYYGVIGEAPHREFIVEWRNVKHYLSQEGITFQVVFFEDSSDVLFNYLDVAFESDSYSAGESATIGIQSTPDKFVQFSANKPLLKPESSLRFSTVTANE